MPPVQRRFGKLAKTTLHKAIAPITTRRQRLAEYVRNGKIRNQLYGGNVVLQVGPVRVTNLTPAAAEITDRCLVAAERVVRHVSICVSNIVADVGHHLLHPTPFPTGNEPLRENAPLPPVLQWVTDALCSDDQADAAGETASQHAPPAAAPGK